MAIQSLNGLSSAVNLPQKERELISECVQVYNKNIEGNRSKLDYYNGHVLVKNLGIAVPNKMANINMSCSWPSKAVDSLQARSRFDSFVYTDGSSSDELNRIVRDNNLIVKYNKAVTDELIHGCVFATLSRNEKGRASIMFHSACTSAALWDAVNDRILCGFTIVDGKKSNEDTSYVPSLVNFYTNDAVWTLYSYNNKWYATKQINKMGRPLMVALVYRGNVHKPFGRSRINRAVRSITDNYMRASLRAEIAAEFYTTPQRYLLGANEEDLDMDKWSAYIGNIFVAAGEDSGDVEYGQLPASSMSPHLEYIRSLASQFATATNVPVSYLGLETSNPTSAEAMQVEAEQLIVEADELNENNGNAMREIALMAIAIENNKSYDELSDDDLMITAHYKDAARPSIVSQSDAMTKIASVDPGFAGTSVFYESLGFDSATVSRIEGEKRKTLDISILNNIAS